jgi:hypothetical protein
VQENWRALLVASSAQDKRRRLSAASAQRSATSRFRQEKPGSRLGFGIIQASVPDGRLTDSPLQEAAMLQNLGK